MATTTEMIEATGVNVVTEQDFELDIPVLSGLQRQGDVIVIPHIVGATAKTPRARDWDARRARRIRRQHPRHLRRRRPVFCDVQSGSATELRVALLSVPDGSTAYLGHPEHGYMGIAPGSYEIRRQREMAEEMRMVAD